MQDEPGSLWDNTTEARQTPEGQKLLRGAGNSLSLRLGASLAFRSFICHLALESSSCGREQR